MVEFEFDEDKSKANLKKHGIDLPAEWSQYGYKIDGVMSPVAYVEYAAEKIAGAVGSAWKNRKPGGISPNAMMPTRQPRPALAQTNLNLPHDPVYGARAIVAAMGEDYAHRLIDSLTTYLQDKKEGDA